MPLYNRGKLILVDGTTDWATADIDVLLVDETYTFDVDDNVVSDITGEISTTNYARQNLGSPTITEDDANNRLVLDGADFSISSLGPATAGPTVGGAVIFDNAGGADASRNLIGFIDLTNTQVNGSDFTITWSADGIFYLENA